MEGRTKLPDLPGQKPIEGWTKLPAPLDKVYRRGDQATRTTWKMLIERGGTKLPQLPTYSWTRALERGTKLRDLPGQNLKKGGTLIRDIPGQSP